MKRILIVIGVIIALILIFLAYQGAFRGVTVTEEEMPGYSLMGMDHKGPYEQIGEAFEKLRKSAEAKGLNDLKFAGVYFDHPDSVPKSELRAMAAVIVKDSQDSMMLASIPGCRAFRIEPGRALTTSIPTHGMISMIIAAMKAYPALNKAAVEKGGMEKVRYVYELYEEKSTRFIMQYGD